MDATTSLTTEVAYATVRDRILKGQLQPGERLVTQRVATLLGISRTPVKEALARIETEGLVQRSGNWGYTVRRMTLRDAEEIFEARLVVEVAAAELAARRVTDPEIVAMRELIDQARQHLRKSNLADFQIASRGIHEEIAKATGNRSLYRMFKQVNDLTLLFGVSLLRLNPSRAEEILRENELIVTSLAKRQSAEVARLMRKHIERGHASFRATVSALRPEVDLA